MSSHDEDLTLENVDERIESLLHTQTDNIDLSEPLAHTVHDLRRVYDEEKRLKHVWKQISNRTEQKETFLGEKITMQDTYPYVRAGSFHDGLIQQERPPRYPKQLRNVVLVAATIILAAALIGGTGVLFFMFRGGSIAPAQQVGANPTPLQITQIPIPTTSLSQVHWTTYQSTFYTIQYPNNWTVITLPTPGGNSMLQQEVMFRPSANSDIYLSVSLLRNGQWNPDSLLKNDPLYKSGNILNQGQTMSGDIDWSTALVDASTNQPPSSTRVEVAYANHNHPYRIEFGAQPEHFPGNSEVLNAMFQSFKEI
ncbi:MAG TPA: hypothetical protein VFN35_20765 [Ktedonobacteraceae bacterium]|nr:hypothetical protein [Ktedonobacteraceae bacterium]